MNEEIEKIKKFTEEFFRSLKCEVFWENDVLKVENVPADFEKYFGKRSPYYFVFEKDKQRGKNELVMQGSFLLKAMASYIGKSGSATLLKLDFDLGSTEDIKKSVKVRGCKIISLAKKHNFDFLTRFTIQTTFQYMNDKEQLMNSIFVNKENVVDFDLKKYKVIEGVKREISVGDLKKEYVIAKVSLKKLLEKKISEIGGTLSRNLEKESNRIGKHFEHQIKEIDDSIERFEKQIIEAGKQIEKERDVESARLKIARAQENLEKLKREGMREKLEKEKEFFINDEVRKHSLDINNDLINTTIIYYPIFILTMFLKNKDTSRRIEMSYDPLAEKASSLFCESCERKLEELEICSSGHLVCPNCVLSCPNCQREICKSCTLYKCEKCGKGLCKKCVEQCSKCRGRFCSLHIREDKISGKKFCTECTGLCSSCGQFSEKSFLRDCPNCNRKVCSKCIRIGISGKDFCKACDGKE